MEKEEIMDQKKNVKLNIVGIGPGSLQTLTREAMDAISEACCIIGAGRMLALAKSIKDEDEACYYETYKTEEIVDLIESHANEIITVLFSGDVGFYSGAKTLMQRYQNSSYEVRILPGISSGIYFLDRLAISWENVHMTSCHGMQIDLPAMICEKKRVCALLGTTDAVAMTCEQLVAANLGDTKVYVGERLSYEDEQISMGTAKTFLGKTFDKLSVAYFEISDAADVKTRLVSAGMPDSEFLRDEADGKIVTPMTKEEVRCLSIAKLRLTAQAVVYDIGAGTGSVSVELARLLPDSQIFAIEKKKSAIDILKKNRENWKLGNLKIIEGNAPDILRDLEKPTHVFVGGSDGNLEEILDAVIEKNPKVRVVATAVTMETISAFEQYIKRHPEYEDSFEMLLVNISRSHKAGNYHLMKAENPIHIMAFGGN